MKIDIKLMQVLMLSLVFSVRHPLQFIVFSYFLMGPNHNRFTKRLWGKKLTNICANKYL